MTKKENFVAINSILNEMGHSEFDEFIAHEIELLSRKRSKSDKPTKNQIANEGIKAQIVEILSSAENRLRASDIQKVLDEDYSLPKVTSMLTQLVDEGKVIREKEKKVSYFSL